MSWMTSVSSLHTQSSSPWLCICRGGPRGSILSDSSFSNSSQSMFQKFLGELSRALARARSKVISIGRWSVFIPGVLGRVSHVMIASRASLEMNTWSSLVHRLVMLCRCVGIPGGSMKLSPASATVLISSSALFKAALVNSLVSAGLSQCRWWRLKSLSQMVILVSVLLLLLWLLLRLQLAWVNASSWWMVLFFLHSLYMLSMSVVPQLLLSWTTVMSPEGKSICFHCSVSILLLIRNRDLVLCGSFPCVVGYTEIQSLEVIVVLNVLIAGSWSATRSMPLLASAVLDIRLC
jgi:hypothetical protein